MYDSVYNLTMPLRPDSSVIFASPHSGRDYPAEFLRRTILDAHTIRSSEDAFVDELFATAPMQGAPLLVARVPRAFIDFNRAEDELDPALIAGAPRRPINPRINSGLGVIPRVVANGRAIYAGKLPLSEAEDRLARYWRPWHSRIDSLMSSAVARYGEAILIDCHSMPHEALDGAAFAGRPRPQVVLGDRFGASARGDIVDGIEAAFAAAGFRVARNAPFAGAFSAERYGRPAERRHVVQIEIDRAIYLDERRIEKGPGFADAKRRLALVISEIAAIGRQARPLAAE